jgi:hypothetical protein
MWLTSWTLRLLQKPPVEACDDFSFRQSNLFIWVYSVLCPDQIAIISLKMQEIAFASEINCFLEGKNQIWNYNSHYYVYYFSHVAALNFQPYLLVLSSMFEAQLFLWFLLTHNREHKQVRSLAWCAQLSLALASNSGKTTVWLTVSITKRSYNGRWVPFVQMISDYLQATYFFKKRCLWPTFGKVRKRFKPKKKALYSYSFEKLLAIYEPQRVITQKATM